MFRASRGLFEPTLVRLDGKHYQRTASSWLSRLRARRAEALEIASPAMVQKYEKYLALLAVGFNQSTMNLLRVSFKRHD